MNEIVVVDDLSFSVRHSARRRTVGLTIDRGGEMVLSVPSDCPTETARQIAGAKRLWIYTKLAQRERLARPLAAREFVTGEGFAYLGRTYRLQLIDPSGTAEPPLRLQHGRFLLLRPERQLFSSRRSRLRVPGIGTIHGFWASSQASATWAGLAFFRCAMRPSRSTKARFA